MIFYLLHNFINNVNFAEDWNESKKNIFTFIIGGTLYVLLYVFLEYLVKMTKIIFIEMLHKFFLYFVIIDAIAMATLYKLYWGRSILNEGVPNEDSNWVFDEDKHKYNKRQNLEEDELRNFVKKSQKLDNIKKDVDEELDDMKDTLQQMEDKTNDISEALLYHPDSELAKDAEKDFIKLSSSHLDEHHLDEHQLDDPQSDEKD